VHRSSAPSSCRPPCANRPPSTSNRPSGGPSTEPGSPSRRSAPPPTATTPSPSPWSSRRRAACSSWRPRRRRPCGPPPCAPPSASPCPCGPPSRRSTSRPSPPATGEPAPRAACPHPAGEPGVPSRTHGTPGEGMSLLRVLGRPMLASMFVAGGLDSVRNPRNVSPAAESVVRPVTERVDAVPDRTEDAVRLSGAVQVVGGLLLASGRLSRPAALGGAAALVPTPLAVHGFWEVDGPSARDRQRIHFLKKLSMLGGLLIPADDTGSAPSLLWRGRHAAYGLRRDAHLVRRSVRAGARPAAAM